MLRLQLAAAENLATERLTRAQTIKSPLATAKDACMRDAHELTPRVGALEAQMRAAHDIWAEVEHTAHVVALKDCVRADSATYEDAVRHAVAHARSEGAPRAVLALAEERRKWEGEHTMARGEL